MYKLPQLVPNVARILQSAQEKKQAEIQADIDAATRRKNELRARRYTITSEGPSSSQGMIEVVRRESGLYNRRRSAAWVWQKTGDCAE